MSVDYQGLIGKTLDEAKEMLEKNNILYEIEFTRGFKDREILTDSYVIRVLTNQEKVKLTASLFKTKIG